MWTFVLLSLAGLVLIVLLASVVYAAWMAHKLTTMERVPPLDHPDTLGVAWEDVAFPSRGDLVPLSGWYLPSPDDNRCIILVQGTQQHRNDPEIRSLQLGRDLVEHGFSVLLFDFRARGESGGNRSSEGDREQWDVLGAIDYVAERGIPLERIGLVGFSLGAGVALLVAAQETRLAAVVSDSGFLDYMLDLRRLRIGPIYAPRWFAWLIAWSGKLFFKADFTKVRPAQVVGEIPQPIFFIHGENDPVISPEETKELHVASANQEDRVWIVPGVEHVNTYRKMPAAYVGRVAHFFQRHMS